MSESCPECGRDYDRATAWTFYQTAWQHIHPIRTPILYVLMILLGSIWITVDQPQRIFATSAPPARYASAVSMTQTARSMVELYANQHGHQYPTLKQLQYNWAPLVLETHGESGAVYGPYLQKPPINPFTGSSRVVAPGQASPRDGWVYDETSGYLRYVLPTQAKFDEIGAKPHEAVVASRP